MPTCYNNAFSASFAQDASHRARGLGTLPSHRGGILPTVRCPLLCFALLCLHFRHQIAEGGTC